MANLHGRFTISIESSDKFCPAIETALESLESDLQDVLDAWQKANAPLTAELIAT